MEIDPIVVTAPTVNEADVTAFVDRLMKNKYFAEAPKTGWACKLALEIQLRNRRTRAYAELFAERVRERIHPPVLRAS